MPSSPKADALPYVKLDIVGFTSPVDLGTVVRRAEYRAMLNAGYVVRFELSDAQSSIINSLIKQDYLVKARKSPIVVKYQFFWCENAEPPEQATAEETAYIASLKPHGTDPDINYLEFICIDPSSWYLSAGDASGAAWKGRISDVIYDVCGKYAPDILAIVSNTTDSTENYWYQFRLDPRSFIDNLISIASPFTSTKTNFIVIPDNDKTITFQDQGSIQSNYRAYYTRTVRGELDTLHHWSALLDNALSLVNTQIVTSGLSAISGEYFDKTTDGGKNIVYVNDSTTGGKQFAYCDNTQAFSKPPVGEFQAGIGWTSGVAPPELYSAGDIGADYRDYIDGVARRTWLDMCNLLERAVFQVTGHGEWLGCEGLGTDTVYIDWNQSDEGDTDTPYWCAGWWICYGYKHVLTNKYWTTDLYCARFDQDATGRPCSD